MVRGNLGNSEPAFIINSGYQVTRRRRTETLPQQYIYSDEAICQGASLMLVSQFEESYDTYSYLQEGVLKIRGTAPLPRTPLPHRRYRACNSTSSSSKSSVDATTTLLSTRFTMAISAEPRPPSPSEASKSTSSVRMASTAEEDVPTACPL